MNERTAGHGVAKILIRVNNWIGDVVMVSPALRAVRRTYPHAEVTLLARSWVIDSLRGSPYFDRLIEYDRKGAHAGGWGRWKLIQRLRREHYDMALLFQKAFEAALFASMARIPRRIGFSTDARGWLLTDALPLPKEGHHVEHFLQIAEAAGCDTSDRRLSFHVTPAARDAAYRFMRQQGLLEAPLRVGIHAGASKAPRAWHASRFAEVATSLASQLGARVLLFGSDADAPLLETIRRESGDVCLPPPRGQSLQVMAALMEHCHLVVCNDSGPMHVAAALRIPIVALFGPGSPERTGPFTDPALVRVLTRRFPCSPCRQDFFRECQPAESGKPFCLEEITAAEVVAASQDLLGLAPRSVLGISGSAAFENPQRPSGVTGCAKLL
ncbi:MAG TPA: lipopolysaccharide heptosyltransferase II [Candidatus Polarisedimenticolia bacterium]|nr:lipopolysaccharide heptosyltransferase II [Candidatus Polarisedimenticolia bacterium]